MDEICGLLKGIHKPIQLNQCEYCGPYVHAVAKLCLSFEEVKMVDRLVIKGVSKQRSVTSSSYRNGISNRLATFFPSINGPQVV